MKTKEIILPINVEVQAKHMVDKRKSNLKSIIFEVVGGLCLLPLVYAFVVLFLAGGGAL